MCGEFFTKFMAQHPAGQKACRKGLGLDRPFTVAGPLSCAGQIEGYWTGAYSRPSIFIQHHNM